MKNKRQFELSARKYIREALGLSNFGDQIPDFDINVSPVVDPKSKVSGLGMPVNPAFVPSNKVELMYGIESHLKDIDELDIPNLFDAIKKTIEDFEDNQEEPEGTAKMEKNEQLEALRKVVKKMISETLSEAWKDLDKDDDDSDWAAADEKEGFSEIEPELPEVPGSAGGEEDYSRPMDFAEIAKELGFNSPRGAQGIVDTVISKLRFLMSIPEEARDFLVLVALDDYIEYLKSSGEVTDEDETLLRAHPEMIQELPGFREHMQLFIRRGMREYGEEHDDDYQTHFDKMQQRVEDNPQKFTSSFKSKMMPK